MRTCRRPPRGAHALALLSEVGIPAPDTRIDNYPHQFSGGMRQRVVLALALAPEPELIIADEPTTALDVSVQAQIIALIRRLARQRGTAVMLITHDMGVIAETADRVAVMYAGRIVEIGPVRDVVKAPLHPYTEGLMGSIPTLDGNIERLVQIPGTMPRLGAIPTGCAFHPRCPRAFAPCATDTAGARTGGPLADRVLALPRRAGRHRGGAMTAAPLVEVENVGRIFDVSKPWLNRLTEGLPRQLLPAVANVSFTIARRETFALVGESGSGKSTIAKMIVGLVAPTTGSVVIDGVSMTDPKQETGRRQLRRRIQMVFQDPYASLNPRWRARDIVAEPLRAFAAGIRARRTSAPRSTSCSRLVGLDPADGAKYPHEFSGGQRQRIAIARALARKAGLHRLRRADLGARRVGAGADPQPDAGSAGPVRPHLPVHQPQSRGGAPHGEPHRRAVSRAPGRGGGRQGACSARPRHPYTRMLLDAVPDLDPSGRARKPIEGEVPNPIDPPPGCAFHPRCRYATARCRTEQPQLIAAGTAMVACHAVAEGRT